MIFDNDLGACCHYLSLTDTCQSHTVMPIFYTYTVNTNCESLWDPIITFIVWVFFVYRLLFLSYLLFIADTEVGHVKTKRILYKVLNMSFLKTLNMVLLTHLLTYLFTGVLTLPITKFTISHPI